MVRTQPTPSAWALEESIVHLLHRSSQAAEERFTRLTGGSGITPRQLAVLATVARDPNVSQTDIVHRTGVDRSTLADIVRRLVKNGLLHRHRTRDDARTYAIRLTQKGIDLLTEVGEIAAAAEQALLEPLSRDEREKLTGMLQRLVQSASLDEGTSKLAGNGRGKVTQAMARP